MFVAIWDSLTSRVQSTILEHKNNFQQDSPALLYYILCKYTGKQNYLLCLTLHKFNTLNNSFKFADKHNVDKFATYVKSLEEKLRESEGKDNHYHKKAYETLITSHVGDFNLELKVWRSDELQKTNTYICDALLSKAREHYQNLITCCQWPKYRGPNTTTDKPRRKRRKRVKKTLDSDPTNITTLFISLIKSQEAQTKALTTSFSFNKKYENNKYAYNKQYRKGKSFKEHHKLMKWVHTKPTHSTTKELHGLIWTWCNTCEKMGYHTLTQCKGKKAVVAVKKRSKAHTNTARVRKNKQVIDSLSEEEQVLSDLDFKDCKPHAKR